MQVLLRSTVILILLVGGLFITQFPGCQQTDQADPLADYSVAFTKDRTAVTLRFTDNAKLAPVRVFLRSENRAVDLGPDIGWYFPVSTDRNFQDWFHPINPEQPILKMVYYGESRNTIHYFLTGEVTLQLVPGDYELTAYKGLEYTPLHARFTVTDQPATQSFAMQRWIDLQARDWYCADGHLHLKRTGTEDAVYAAMQAADGLHIGNYLFWWKEWPHAQQKTFGKRGEYAAGGHILRSGEEPLHLFGHILLLGTNRLIMPVSQGFTSNVVERVSSDMFEEARREGGLNGYAHGGGVRVWNRNSAAVMDLPLGLVDFLEVFQFNELLVEQWYDMLNAGFRLPPSSGTDFPWNLDHWNPWPPLLSPLSAERMYVNVPEELTWENWAEGVKAGRTVLTNGPFVEFTVNGRSLSEEVSLKKDEHEVTVDITVDHWRPMKEAALIVNGKREQVYTNPDQRVHWEIHETVTIGRCSWMAVHVRSDSTGAVRDEEILLQAHTAPVYIRQEGPPVVDAAAVGRLMERVREISGNLLSPRYRFVDPRVRESLERRSNEALAAYQKLLNAAQQ